MQSLDWNDLTYLLALYRTGRLVQAGRSLGVSDTTVARRIKALETALGTALFLRSASGRYEPTDAALDILGHAETVEAEMAAIAELSGAAAQKVAGRVRISSVPIIVNRMLVPALAPLMQAHPALTVELVPRPENVDLSKREADLAVRFARPASGGLRTKAQKLGTVSFAAYAARGLEPARAAALPWITYDEAHADLPQARWLDAAAAMSGQAAVKVADAETALHAAAEGLGRTLLPRGIAAADKRLRAVELDDAADCPSREVWLLSHVDQSARMSVQVVKEWLAALDWR